MTKKDFLSMSGSTLLLRAVIIIISLVVLGICTFGLPALIASELAGDFDYGYIFIAMYISAIPLFVALYNTLLLLGYIDKNKAFTTDSVASLKYIKYCGYIISGFYAFMMPYIFYVADRDDAPGLAAVGFVIVGASLVVATAAAVIQRLFQNAVDIKSENDLTV